LKDQEMGISGGTYREIGLCNRLGQQFRGRRKGFGVDTPLEATFTTGDGSGS
jgi:hypothetical protein